MVAMLMVCIDKHTVKIIDILNGLITINYMVSILNTIGDMVPAPATSTEIIPKKVLTQELTLPPLFHEIRNELK